MTSLPAQLLIAPIRFYQRFITPYTPATCRYYPTCSAYAVTALRTHGAVIGTGLTIWRLLRCNPWSSGGIDHVPAKGQLRHRHVAVASDVQIFDGDPASRSSASEYSGEQEPVGQRERGEASGSSSTVGPAEHRSAGTDLDAPPTAARQPMSGRSAA
jgi:putative membrane protein insertion efficiency factor